jgi:transposase InsO family protein
MLDLVAVSRSGYYDWRARKNGLPGPRQARYQQIVAAVQAAHEDSNGVHGAPRITADLRDAGWQVSRKTVAKAMQQQQLRGVSPRRWQTTTVADESAPPLPDLVGRDFDRGRLDAVWISDITYLGTGQGWLYLCAVRDACSRRVLGWTIADHMRDDLVLDALKMAIAVRGPRPARVIFHADRGSQYTSNRVVDYARDHGIDCSAGKTGVCFDNAMAESFWATLKVEFYYRHSWPSKAQAIREVNGWINHYNTRRRHSALAMISPIQFELHKQREPALAA